MSIQGEANEFLNLLFGELNEKRFAQVIKVIYIWICMSQIRCHVLGLWKIRSIKSRLYKY